jgi:hypothetical protein
VKIPGKRKNKIEIDAGKILTQMPVFARYFQFFKINVGTPVI